MAEFQLKDFLRSHGFRHLRDRDRGAAWGNGFAEVFVEKTYKDKAKLRAVMDQIRTGERRKIEVRAAEERKLNLDAEMLTPEQHRIRQEAIARSASAQPELEAALNNPPPEKIASPPLSEPTEDVKKKKGGFKKFSGPERLYVFGRLKAMLQAKLEDQVIADALSSEAVKRPDGRPIDSTYVAQMRANWKSKPESMKQYATILHPRRTEAPPPPPRPVVVNPTPKVERSRFGLPLSVDSVLQDVSVGDDERLQVLLIFVDIPTTARLILSDPEITAKKKISVVEALGELKKKAAP